MKGGDVTIYDHDRRYGRCSRCGQPLAPETMERFTEWDLIDHELVGSNRLRERKRAELGVFLTPYFRQIGQELAIEIRLENITRREACCGAIVPEGDVSRAPLEAHARSRHVEHLTLVER